MDVFERIRLATFSDDGNISRSGRSCMKGYFWIRRKLDHNYELETAHQAAVVGSEKTGDHPRFKAMALLAHGVGAAANAGKIIAYQGNPLAINYAQWLRFFHALVSWMRDKFRSPTDVLIVMLGRILRNLNEGGRELTHTKKLFLDWPLNQKT